jgi:uncharacterized membrane protein
MTDPGSFDALVDAALLAAEPNGKRRAKLRQKFAANIANWRHAAPEMCAADIIAVLRDLFRRSKRG